MNGTPLLRQLAQRVMTQAVGASRDPEALASAAMDVFAHLLSSLSSLLGEVGSPALLRRSARLMEATFPFYAEVRVAGRNDLLSIIGERLRKQPPDVAGNASVALLATYLELLETFIGERLTRQILQEAWPDLLTSSPQEKQR